MHTVHHPATTPRRSPWLSLAAALCMAACAHSPQAAVSESVAVAPSGATTVVQERGCGATGRPAALKAMEEGLRAHGMALKAQCTGGTGSWVVQVVVVDGLRASKLVRGPLADGGEVDMGSPAGVAMAAAQAQAKDLSPDVHHNRRWLRALMERHQFDNLPDAWWHYAQRGAPVQAGDTDLAAR